MFGVGSAQAAVTSAANVDVKLKEVSVSHCFTCKRCLGKLVKKEVKVGRVGLLKVMG